MKMEVSPSENFIQHYVQNSMYTNDEVTDVLFYCNDGLLPSYQIALATISPFLKLEFQQNSYDKVIAIVLPGFVCSEIKEYLLDLFNYNNIRHAELNELLGCAILGNPLDVDEDDFEENNDDNEAKDIINEEYTIPESPQRGEETMENGSVNSESDDDEQRYIETEQDEERNTTIAFTNTSSNFSRFPKRKSKSMVWDHFFKIDKDSSICHYCRRNISCSSGNYKGMRSHLACSHPEKVGVDFVNKVRGPNRGQPKVLSIVWNHFDKIDKESSICRYCRKNIKCRLGVTKGMRGHLASFHPEIVGQEFVNKIRPNRAKVPRRVEHLSEKL